MHRILFGLGLVWAAAGQSIVTVQNAAALGNSLPAGAVAPGSLVTLQIVRGGPVPINPDLSKVSLKIRPRAGGADFDATVLQGFVGSYLALVPPAIPPGDYDFILTVEGQANLPATLSIVPMAPGLFAWGRTGFGPALAQNDGPDTSPRLNLFTDPARPGDYLTLWGTGLGKAASADVIVEIAGVPVPASYAGPSSFPGLDQINVPLPAATPDTCFVAVRVRAGAGVSNQTTFAKAGPLGPCNNPFGFTEAELRALDEGGTVRLGLVSLRSEVLPDIGPASPATYSRNEAVFGEFARRDAESIAILAQPYEKDDTYFSCRLQNSSVIPQLIFSDAFDAGDNLHLTGPGKSLDVPHPGVPVLYLNVLPPKDLKETPFFIAGAWTLNAPGGATVGTFQTSRQLPPGLRWLNRESLADLDRAKDQTILWANDGYTEEDVMTVTLTGMICRAPASSGHLTLPASLLSQLTRTPVARLQLRLAPRPDRRVRLDLPLVAGGRDHAVYEYLFTDTLVVNLR